MIMNGIGRHQLHTVEVFPSQPSNNGEYALWQFEGCKVVYALYMVRAIETGRTV